MGEGSDDFISTSKLVFTANALPEISPPSPGIERRIMPLELPASLDADIARRDDLIAEVPQIVSWAIQGAREWYREGLAPTSIIESASLDFARISDQIGAWLDECCELDDTFTVTMRELQGSYLEWSDGRRLTARQFRDVHVARVRKYHRAVVAPRKGKGIEGFACSSDEPTEHDVMGRLGRLGRNLREPLTCACAQPRRVRARAYT